MKTTTKEHYTDRAIKALNQAAAKAGISLEGISVKYATLDRTWGDKDGMVVLGGTAEMRERCATYLYNWCCKNLGSGSYDSQNSIQMHGVVGWLTQDIGSDGVFPIEPPSYYPEAEKADYRSRIQLGYAVATKYYPCAD